MSKTRKQVTRICIGELRAAFEEEWKYENREGLDYQEPCKDTTTKEKAFYWWCLGWARSQTFSEINNGLIDWDCS
jgi:hypothetical protein